MTNHLNETQIHPAASLDTFAGPIQGQWTLYSARERVSYQFFNLVADVIFMEDDWIIAGTCCVKMPTGSVATNQVFSVEYKKRADTLTWNQRKGSQLFSGISTAAAVIEIKSDKATRRVMLRVRKESPFGNDVIQINGFIIAQPLGK